MAQGGQAPIFNSAQPEEWEAFVGQLEFYLKVNRITEDGMKVAALLGTCGKDIYKLAVGLCSPTGIGEVKYDDLIDKLNQHFNPHMSEMAWTYQFVKRDQLPGESASAFMAAVRQVARLCNFENLEKRLRNRIVVGLRDRKLRQKLFAKPGLTLSKYRRKYWPGS